MELCKQLSHSLLSGSSVSSLSLALLQYPDYLIDSLYYVNVALLGLLKVTEEVAEENRNHQSQARLLSLPLPRFAEYVS